MESRLERMGTTGMKFDATKSTSGLPTYYQYNLCSLGQLSPFSSKLKNSPYNPATNIDDDFIMLGGTSGFGAGDTSSLFSQKSQKNLRTQKIEKIQVARSTNHKLPGLGQEEEDDKPELDPGKKLEKPSTSHGNLRPVRLKGALQPKGDPDSASGTQVVKISNLVGDKPMQIFSLKFGDKSQPFGFAPFASNGFQGNVSGVS